MPFDFEFFLHLHIPFLSVHSTAQDWRPEDNLWVSVAASCHAGVGDGIWIGRLGSKYFCPLLWPIVCPMHIFIIIFMTLVKRTLLSYLKKQGKKSNSLTVCFSVIFFFCCVRGFESLVFVFYLWEQAELDNKQPLCQTARFRLSKLHRAESPSGWSKYLMKDTCRRGQVLGKSVQFIWWEPGLTYLCTI